LLEAANLAVCLARQGYLDEPTKLLRDSLDGLLRLPMGGSSSRPSGRTLHQAMSQSSQTYGIMAMLAELLRAQGQREEALRLYTDAIEGRRRTLGEVHPATRKLESDAAELRKEMAA
jgi:hypothetical protein